MDGQRTVIAEILRPRGIRGQLLAISQTDVPGRLETLSRAHVHLPDGSDSPVEIAEAWPHKENWVLKFAGIDSVEQADRFRGADLWIPRAERGELPAGEFFRSDLIGCRLIDRRSGEVGTVQGWQEYGAAPLMEVLSDRGEALVPFAAALCEVDLAGRTITLDVPGGLLDL